MIQLQSVYKYFGPNAAVAGIDLDIHQGEVVGLLGPNGAGKSTTIRMVTGFMPPTSGRITVAGFDVLKQGRLMRRMLGYMPENSPLYPEMKVAEYLDYRGRMFGLQRKVRRERIEAMVERCSLQPVRDRNIGALSKGNRQRAALAQALLHDPPVIILDEPTSGLDPIQVQHFRQLLADLRGKHTVLISSHILTEIEQTTDRVVVMARGRVVADGKLAELHRLVGKRLLIVEVKASLKQATQALESVQSFKIKDSRPVEGWTRLSLQAMKDDAMPEQIAEALAEQKFAIRELRWTSGNLEDLFTRVTSTSPATEEVAG